MGIYWLDKWSLYDTNPNNAPLKGEILQIYHTFVVFHSPQMGNFS